MTTTVVNRMGELLARRERREMRRITNTEIAQNTGVSVRVIERWRDNRVQRFDAEVIVKLCRYFDCGVSDLLIIEDVQSPEESAPAFAYAS